MHNDEQPGASRPPSPAPDQKRGTLAAFWGQPGQLSFSKEKEKAPQRKRRKKEDGPPQGRLVFGAEGMSVATPPAPPAPEDGEDKKGRKRKTEAAGDGECCGGGESARKGDRFEVDEEDRGQKEEAVPLSI